MMFGVRPRIAGSKFFPRVPVPIVPRSRIPPPQEMVRRMIGDPLPPPKPSPAMQRFLVISRGRKIVAEVALAHGMTVAEIRGESRSPGHVTARTEAAHRMQRELGYTTTQIGNVLNRDHSTITHALAKPYAPRSTAAAGQGDLFGADAAREKRRGG